MRPLPATRSSRIFPNFPSAGLPPDAGSARYHDVVYGGRGMTDPPISAKSGPRHRQTHFAAWLCLLAALAVGVYLQNPAIALFGGLTVRLALGVNPVGRGIKLGTISLQSAVVLLGLTLGFDRVITVSADYGVIVGIYVLMTLLLGWILTKPLRANGTEAALLTSGTAICGATAIATLVPVVGAKAHQFAATTGVVFLLNAVALFTFPYIGGWLGLSQEAFGAWAALAIHDTSSVIATAAIYGDEAAAVATTVKLGRTLWLIPLAFAASLIYSRQEAKLRVPPFILLFVAAAVVGGFVEFGEVVDRGIGFASKVLLVIALGLIGLQLDRRSLRKLSLATVALGVGLWLAVAPLALALVLFA